MYHVCTILFKKIEIYVWLGREKCETDTLFVRVVVVLCNLTSPKAYQALSFSHLLSRPNSLSADDWADSIILLIYGWTV